MKTGNDWKWPIATTFTTTFTTTLATIVAVTLASLPGAARASTPDAPMRTLTLENLDTSHQAELLWPMVFAPVVELRALSPLTSDDDGAYWINSGLRFWLGERVQAVTRVSVPLNDVARSDDAPVYWELGSSFRF